MICQSQGSQISHPAMVIGTRQPAEGVGWTCGFSRRRGFGGTLEDGYSVPTKQLFLCPPSPWLSEDKP
ncbi:hypothetical protein BD311DRAFT_777577 [Dichomitus squalens]|uniref:Uncharacterized protein n=1 Tax=Dichomitus squalens TaxID=114155 RepID=A0A4Q9MSY0_9APHY|nr:hypothetical protein BD311DRAFT_777577 [Dichomitus squalens]